MYFILPLLVGVYIFCRNAVLKRSVQNLKREILELQCAEEKLVATTKLIGDPLDCLGNAQLPSGLIEFAEYNDQACISFLLFAWLLK